MILTLINTAFQRGGCGAPCTLFLLPRGEGQDEGQTSTSSLPTLRHAFLANQFRHNLLAIRHHSFDSDRVHRRRPYGSRTKELVVCTFFKHSFLDRCHKIRHGAPRHEGFVFQVPEPDQFLLVLRHLPPQPDLATHSFAADFPPDIPQLIEDRFFRRQSPLSFSIRPNMVLDRISPRCQNIRRNRNHPHRRNRSYDQPLTQIEDITRSAFEIRASSLIRISSLVIRHFFAPFLRSSRPTHLTDLTI